MCFEDIGQLVVVMLSGTLTLEGHYQSLRRVTVKKLLDLTQHIPKCLLTSEGDGEDAMGEYEPVLGWIIRPLRVSTNIEETDTVIKLFARTNSLTAYGWRSNVACGGVVSAWYGEGRGQGIILELAHPAVEIGGGK